MAKESIRKHEVAFCADVAKWAEKIFEEDQNLPFGSSDIESFGKGSQKRQDLRFYARRQGGQGKLALCGEVKIPGTAQGRSTKTLEPHEGEAQLPDATNLFESTTVYFGKKGKAHLVCDSRAEAELLYTIAQTGQRGTVAMPVTETDCQHVLDALKTRLEKEKSVWQSWPKCARALTRCVTK
jgi:hypothetical protein